MQPEASSLVFLQYLTTVFDNVEDAILLVGIEPKDHYRLLMANEGFFRHTGYKRDCVGKHIHEVISPEGFNHLAEQYRKVVSNKKPFVFHHWYNVPIGRQAFTVKLIPILNAVGEVIQIASISRNETEIENLKLKIAETTKKLEKLTKALAQN